MRGKKRDFGKVCTWEQRGQLERLNIQIRVTTPLQALIQSKACSWEQREQIERLNIQIRVTTPLQAFNQKHACI